MACSLICHNCEAIILPDSSLCFFDQGADAWHLIVKPELEESVWATTIHLVPHPDHKSRRFNPRKIIHNECSMDVGNESKVGSAEEPLLCFSAKKTRLSLFKVKKWRGALDMFPSIERRVQSIWPAGWDPQPTEAEALNVAPPLNRPSAEVISSLNLAPFIRCGRVPHDYQVELYVEAMLGSSRIVVLPTGTGKTLVAGMVARCMVDCNPKRFVVFLADRVPLVHQQAQVLRVDAGLRVQEYTGENSSSLNLSTAADIMSLKDDYDVLAMTAQVFLNKLAAGFPLSWCSLLVFDEAHHASKTHPFARILNEHFRPCLLEDRPRLLGLTASPGGKISMAQTGIQLRSLSQAFCGAEFRVPNLYWQQLEDLTARADTECVPVVPSADEEAFKRELVGYLNTLLAKVQRMAVASDYFQLDSNFSAELVEGNLRGELRKLQDFASARKAGPLRAVVQHALEMMSMLWTCHVYSPSASRRELCRYWKRVGCSKEQAAKLEIIRELRWPLSWTGHGVGEGDREEWSSRMTAVIDEVTKSLRHNSNSRVLIFVQKKSTTKLVAKMLGQVEALKKLKVATLVGHSGFDGMSWQEEQKPVLDRFRSGVYRILVATSVAEEGLDVPACNLVIRFDGAVSMTALIQSRGRARKRDSRFVVLANVEEKGVWESRCEEERCMMRAIRGMQQVASPQTHHLCSQLDKARMEWQSGERGGATGEVEAQVEVGEGVVVLDKQDPGGGESLVITLHNVPRSAAQGEVAALFSGVGEVELCDLKVAKPTGQALLHILMPPGLPAHQAYQDLCQNAHLDLRGTRLWLQRDGEGVSAADMPGGATRAPLTRCTVGHMMTPGVFVGVEDLDGPGEVAEVRWVVQKGLLYIELHHLQLRVELPHAAVHGPAVLHAVEGQKTRLYLPLLCCPRLYRAVVGEEDTRWMRLALDGAGVAKAVGEAFVYRLEVAVPGPLVGALRAGGVEVVRGWIEDSLAQGEEMGEGGGGEGDLEADAEEQEVSRKRDRDSVAASECGPNASLLFPFRVRCLLDCLRTEHAHLLPAGTLPDRFFVHLAALWSPEGGWERAEWALMQMPSLLRRFCNPVDVLKAASTHPVPSWGPSLLPLPANHIAIRRATISPLRTLHSPPAPVASNAILRHFQDPDRFLIVNFRDENGGFIHGQESLLLDRVREVLVQGLEVGGETFRLLAATPSQIHSHGCWMTSLSVEKVWDWIGDLSSIRCPSKYLARLGQDLAASRPSLPFHPACLHNANLLQDVVGRGKNKHVFTDGCGKISSAARDAVVRQLGLPSHPPPSVLQVRIGGVKGVVAVDSALTAPPPSPGSSWPSCHLHLRPSMKKFESSRSHLSVLGQSSNQPLYLNRQAITLMLARGVPPHLFEAMQERQLCSLLTLFQDDEVAWAALQNSVRDSGSLLTSWRATGQSVREDALLRSMVRAVYEWRVRDLTEKSRLWVEEGRLLMGVADPSGVLEEGEVFVQLSAPLAPPWEPGAERRTPGEKWPWVLDGLCTVYRNPCLHPGDVRQLKANGSSAVRERLGRDYIDVVVFSVKGERPEADKMSGGDLDGDKYAVIWDESLLPSTEFPSMDFTPGAAVEIGEGEMMSVRHLAESYVALMGSAELGQIANAHLALADTHVDIGGAAHPDCLRLADLHHKAVDAGKTGWTGGIPADLQPKQFPDFMGKTDREVYESPTVLGTMCRRAMSVDHSGEEVGMGTKQTQPDPSLLTTGYEDFLPIAEGLYKSFRSAFRGLCNQFGIESEGEVVTGCVRKVHPHLDRGDVVTTIQELFQTMVTQTRSSFDLQCSLLSSGKQYDLAAACYWVAYSDPDPTDRSLSFLWAILDLLVITATNRTPQRSLPASLPERVSDSLKLEFDGTRASLWSSFVDRANLCEQLEEVLDLLPLPGRQLCMFGSSSTYLFDPNMSDVDVCLLPAPLPAGAAWPDPLPKTSQVALLQELQVAMQPSFPEVRLLAHPEVPLLICDSGSMAVPLDVTAHPPGLLKSLMLRSHIQSCPALLLLLRILLRWGKRTGLVAHKPLGIMTADGLTWMIVAFCLERGYLGGATSASLGVEEADMMSLRSFWFDLLDGMREDPEEARRMADGTLVGEALIQFLTYLGAGEGQKLPGSREGSPLSIIDPLKSDRTCVAISSHSFREFRDYCLGALHLLTSTACVDGLLTAVTRHVRVRLHRGMCAKYKGRKAYYAQKLHLMGRGKASVVITPASSGRVGTRRPPLWADITGEWSAVRRIERYLSGMVDGSVILNRASGSMFVEGSVCQLFQGANSKRDELGFRPYEKVHHLHHRGLELHTTALVAPCAGDTWQAHAFRRLHSAVLRQVEALQRCPEGPGGVGAVIRFGTQYLMHLGRSVSENSLGSLEIEEFEDALAKGRRQAKLWQRQASSGLSARVEGGAEVDSRQKVKKAKTHDLDTQTPVKTDGEGVQKTKPLKEKGLSQALYTQVLQPLDPLVRFLSAHNFQRQSSSDPMWRVTISGLGNEARICLDDALGVLDAKATQRPLRWLAASLTFSSSLANAGFGEEDALEEEARDRPLTARMYIHSKRALEPSSKLMKRLKLLPLLVRKVEEQGIEVVQVGDDFKTEVAHIRKVITTAFVGQLAGFPIRVEMLDVTWWAGWDKGIKEFQTHGQHQEVEVHAEDLRALSNGGAKHVEEFVRGMWHAELSISELVL